MKSIATPSSRSYEGAGWASILGYCLFTSSSAVWVSASFSQISGLALTFITLSLAQIIFLSAASIKKESPISFAVNNLSSVFLLNLLTVSSWLFMFMSLQRIEASVESAIYQGCIPVAVMLCSIFRKEQRFISILTLGPVAISIFLTLLSAGHFMTSEDRLYDPHKIASGILLAAVAGITGGLYIYYSSKANFKGNASTLNILATRFVLLLLITGALGYTQIKDLMLYDLRMLAQLSMLSIAFVIVPIYLLQVSISELGATRVSIITPLVPAIALGIEYLTSPWETFLTPSLIIMVCISVILSNLIYTKHRPSRA